MGLWELQRRFRAARGRRTRDQVVDAALRIPGAPDTLTTDRYHRMETALQHPPREGGELRAVVAVLELSPFDVLRDLSYWPPLPSKPGPEAKAALAQLLLEEAARIGGWRVERTGQHRDKLLVHL